MEAAVEMLLAARRVADYAVKEGALSYRQNPRPSCDHMGALVADTVLQAGLNYSTVVLPRIQTILRDYPKENNTTSLIDLIARNQTALFLNWQHSVKIERFQRLVKFLHQTKTEHAKDLRTNLSCNTFCSELLSLNGIGPKTIDYMSCLVGLDSIAVDRHVRTFAKHCDIGETNYQFLKNVFCYAADLIELPRRDFDAWIWQKMSPQAQYSLSI